MVATRDYFGGSFDARGGHLHALNLALGIARAAASHGARLHEGVEVTGLDTRPQAAGASQTRSGELRPRASCWPATVTCGSLAPKVERRVMPINNYIAVTEPLGAGGRAATDQQRRGRFGFALRRELFSHHAGQSPAVRRRRELRLPVSARHRRLRAPARTEDLSAARPAFASTTPGAARSPSRRPACRGCANSRRALSMPAAFPAWVS